MRDKIVLSKIGYLIKGEALLKLWGGGEGVIIMSPYSVKSIDNKEIIDGFNDNGFGCEEILAVKIEIYELFEMGVNEWFDDQYYYLKDGVFIEGTGEEEIFEKF